MKCELQMFVEWLCVFEGQQLWTHQRDGHVEATLLQSGDGMNGEAP